MYLFTFLLGSSLSCSGGLSSPPVLTQTSYPPPRPSHGFYPTIVSSGGEGRDCVGGNFGGELWFPGIAFAGSPIPQCSPTCKIHHLPHSWLPRPFLSFPDLHASGTLARPSACPYVFQRTPRPADQLRWLRVLQTLPQGWVSEAVGCRCRSAAFVVWNSRPAPFRQAQFSLTDACTSTTVSCFPCPFLDCGRGKGRVQVLSASGTHPTFSSGVRRQRMLRLTSDGPLLQY